MIKNRFYFLLAAVFTLVLTAEGRDFTASCNSETASLDQQPRMVGGGPYILYNDDGSVIIHTFDQQMNLHTKTYPNRESTGKITVYSHEGGYEFSFYLHNRLYTPPARYAELPEKMLVLSDPHGDIRPFVRTLQGNGVIDENLNWIFGRGHLKILGDIQDRGDDQTTILWLVYMLHEQARQAGGYVHFLIGNHEVIVSQHDERYLTPKYLEQAKKIGVRYGDLWLNNSELGRWVNSRNTIQIMHDRLFVHAGISPELIETPLTIEQINDTVRKYMVLPRNYPNRTPVATLIMGGTAGPLWYRSVIQNTLQESVVDQILARY